ncbi:hypothetical protein ACG3SL_02980 [Sphingomonas sp. CJ20]
MSNQTVAERLQVKGTRKLAVLGASAGLEQAIGAEQMRSALATADVVLFAVPDRAAFDATLPEIVATAPPAAILWLAYPKLTSALARDLSRDVLRDLVQRHGLDTVSQIAIDADWSALRLKRV